MEQNSLFADAPAPRKKHCVASGTVDLGGHPFRLDNALCVENARMDPETGDVPAGYSAQSISEQGFARITRIAWRPFIVVSVFHHGDGLPIVSAREAIPVSEWSERTYTYSEKCRMGMRGRAFLAGVRVRTPEGDYVLGQPVQMVPAELFQRIEFDREAA